MFMTVIQWLLRNPIMMNIGGALISSVMVWFIGPHISIGGAHPFASAGVRSVLVAFIILSWFAKSLLTFFVAHRGQSLQKIKLIAQSIGQGSKKIGQRGRIKANHAFSDMQSIWHRDRDRRHFKKTPIYLVFGSSKAGRSTLLGHSGRRLLSAEHYGRQAVNMVRQFDQCNWYFTHEAIFVDCGSYQRSAAYDQHKSLIRALKKHRKSKPIAGVLLLFSLPELILAKHESRQAIMKDFSDHIQMLYKGFRAPLPVYTLFTKSDQINGFSEFFGDLSKEELMQVWGVTFPLQDAHKPQSLMSYFDKQYTQILARLGTHALHALDAEKNDERRDLIFNFPQQMQLFRKPLHMFISELFATLPQQRVLQLRGMYFTSAIQEGQAYDFLAHAIGRRFNLQPAKQQAQHHHRENYFIFRLFEDIILSESNLLGFSERAKRFKRWAYRLAWVLLPCAFVGTTWAMHHAYQETQLSVGRMQNDIDTYQHANNALSAQDASMDHALDALDALRHNEQDAKASNMVSHLFYASHALQWHASSALNRTLHVIYLPRVAANLEYLLTNRPLKTNALYATLKGYLAFSPEHDTQANAIIAPMEITWSNTYKNQPSIQASLRYYLNRSSQSSMDALPLNRPLINKIRLELQQVVPSRRAYALLSIKAIASNIPDIVMPTIVGQSFSQVFADKDQSAMVPALFTAKGYHDIFDKSYQAIAHQVSQDNKAIGLQAQNNRTERFDQIAKEMQHEYNQDYLHAWNKALNHIQTVRITHLDQAAQIFSLLGSDNSPLTKVLNIIETNTADVEGNQIVIADHYKTTNAFSQSALSSSQLAQANDDFKQLSTLFDQLNHAANVDQACFDYVHTYMQSDQKNPLRQLSVIASRAPWPVHGWLTSIVNQAWGVLLGHALHVMNDQWQAQVASYYHAHVENHYPLSRHSQRALTIQSLNDFFSPKGVVSQYFNHYLKPFINTSSDQWKSITVDGHGLQLSRSELAFFQRMVQIQSLYFQSGQTANLAFALTPASLDTRATNMTLTVGSKTLSYAHGPQQPVQYQWPFDASADQATLIVNTFNGHRHVFSAYGPWALFQILQKAQARPLANKSGYLLNFNGAGSELALKVTSDAPLAAFTLSAFDGLRVPTQLTMR
jgi:type VI secretion system protein ImpL